MEFNILDKSKKWVGVMDFFQSAIWTERHYTAGDFELYVEASADNLKFLQKDFYVTRQGSDMVGIIEKVYTTTDADHGRFLIVSGRDLKSLLERRIVWQQTTLKGTVENCIRQLITENVISPAISERKIPDFVLDTPAGFTDEIDLQVTGEDLYTTITKLCKSYGYGFKITFNDTRQFVFSLYRGADRSYKQNENPQVVFSPMFDNLRTVDYFTDSSTHKNVALVAGEGEGLERKTSTVGTVTGLDRREMFVDARDISSNEGKITDTEYKNLLDERGNESLAGFKVTESFDGEIEPAMNYRYNTDYFLGDTVQIENEFDLSNDSKIIEIIECWDEKGYSLTPTFEESEV